MNWKTLLVALAIILIAFSCWVFVYIIFFPPTISISQSLTPNPLDPFSTEFILLDNSSFGLNSMQINCHAQEIEGIYGNIDNNGGLINTSLPTTMNPQQTITIQCPLRGFINVPASDTITYADITFIIKFHSDAIPWYDFTSQQRFLTYPNPSGTLLWSIQ
jgi:hypothetical protein